MSDSFGFSRRNFMKRLGTGSLALTPAPVMGRGRRGLGAPLGPQPRLGDGATLSIGLNGKRLISMLGANMQRILAKNRFIAT